MSANSHKSSPPLHVQKSLENNIILMEDIKSPQSSAQQPVMDMATDESSLKRIREQVSQHDVNSRTTSDFESKSSKTNRYLQKREKRRRYRRNRNLRRHAFKAEPDQVASRATDSMSINDHELLHAETSAQTSTQKTTSESAATSGFGASILAIPVPTKPVPIQEPAAELQGTKKKGKAIKEDEADESNSFTWLIDFVSKVSHDMDYGDALLRDLSDLCSTCRQFVNIGMMSSESTSLLAPMIQSILDTIYSIGASNPEKYLESCLTTIKYTNENLFIMYDWCPGLMQFTSPVNTEKFTEELCSALATIFDESYFHRILPSKEQVTISEKEATETGIVDQKGAQNHDPGEGSSRGPLSVASSSTYEEISVYSIDTDLDKSASNSWYTIISASLSSSDIDIDFEPADDESSEDNSVLDDASVTS